MVSELFTPFHYVTLAVMLLDMVVAVAIVVRAKRNIAGICFGLMLVFGSLWGLEQVCVDIFYPSKFFDGNYSYTTASAIVVFFILFAVLYQNQSIDEIKRLSFRTKLSLVIIALPGAVFFILGLTTDLFIAGAYINENNAMVFVGGQLFDAFNIYFVVCTIIAFYQLIRKRICAVSGRDKKTLNIILSGLACAYGVGITFNILWYYIFGEGLYHSYSPTAVLAVVLVLAYAVMKYRLFGIDVRMSIAALADIVTISFFVSGFIVYGLLLVWFRDNLFVLISVAVVFAFLFFKMRDLAFLMIKKRWFEDFFHNTRRVVDDRPPHFSQQLGRLKNEIELYLGKFFDDVSTDLFYLDDETGVFRCLSGKCALQSIGFSDALINFARTIQGLVLLDDMERFSYLSRADMVLVKDRIKQLRADGMITMRHWTGELVIVAILRLRPNTQEARDKLRFYLQCAQPKWDEIAAKIFTNKRAMESVKMGKTSITETI